MPIQTKTTFSHHISSLSEFDTPAMRSFFADPDAIIANSCIKMFKNKPNDTSTVALVEQDLRQWVVKRYNIKGFWHGVKRALLPTKARISWNNALLLKKLGIPAIKPVALIERRFGCLKGVAYLIAEYQDGILASDYFAKDSPFADHFEQAIHSLSDLIKQMQKQRVVHDDFKLNNILIVDHAAFLLDLDHMVHFKRSSKKFAAAHQKDLIHLENHLLDTPVIHRLFTDAVYPTDSLPTD